MFLGDKIRLARLAENDSQEKLAEKIGVSRQTVIN
ncbi:MULTISPECIES: helix-turn-helix domain-containing protein [Streptococcus]|uniref:Helix-turn-helix domain-containing protein n=1 Tax=Streptococcus caledonicus TaxID=2614158 RepID=A0ABW0UB74_9STRE|nr:helix-turn-helix transcriptional regulator [Streptococcus sp. S784/96/1]